MPSGITCVTCHPVEVIFPPLPHPVKAGAHFRGIIEVDLGFSQPQKGKSSYSGRAGGSVCYPASSVSAIGQISAR